MMSKRSLTRRFAGQTPAPSSQSMSILLKLCVSAAVILFLFSRIKPSQIYTILKAYPVSSLYAPIILYLLFGLWASIKWKMLLPEIRFGPIIRVSFARYFYSLIALGTVTGDVARAYLLGTRDKDRFAVIAASVIVDRVTGFIGLALTGMAGILISSIIIPDSLAILCAAAVFMCLMALFSLRYKKLYLLALKLIQTASRALGPLSRFANPLIRCIDALHCYAKQSRLMILSIGAGVVSQVFCIASIALLSRGLGMTVSLGDWSWIFCVVSMTVLVPVSISGLGIREGSFVALLALLGIGADKALALSLLVFSLDVFLGAIGWLCQCRLDTKISL